MCLDSMNVKNELLLKVANLIESRDNKNLKELINRIESTQEKILLLLEKLKNKK